MRATRRWNWPGKARHFVARRLKPQSWSNWFSSIRPVVTSWTNFTSAWAAEKIVVATEDRIRLFAEASDDFNRCIWTRPSPPRPPNRGRIAHGLLSASFGSAVVGTILPGAGSIYISQTLAFHQPVRIGRRRAHRHHGDRGRGRKRTGQAELRGLRGRDHDHGRRRRGPRSAPAQTVPALMQVVRDWRDLPDAAKGRRRRRRGLRRGASGPPGRDRRWRRRRPTRLGAPLGVVSFDPHPRRWFQKDAAPFRLMTADQMAQALAPLGVDVLYLLPFDAEMAGHERRRVRRTGPGAGPGHSPCRRRFRLHLRQGAVRLARGLARLWRTAGLRRFDGAASGRRRWAETVVQRRARGAEGRGHGPRRPPSWAAPSPSRAR